MKLSAGNGDSTICPDKGESIVLNVSPVDVGRHKEQIRERFLEFLEWTCRMRKQEYGMELDPFATMTFRKGFGLSVNPTSNSIEDLGWLTGT